LALICLRATGSGKVRRRLSAQDDQPPHRDAPAPDTPADNMAAATGHLAVLRKHQGQFDEAERLHEATIELSRKVGERSREYAIAPINAGAFYKEVGRHDRARTVYEVARPIFTEVQGREHPDYILLLSNLADLEMEFGNAEEAAELLTEACGIARSALGERHDFYLSALHNLGYAQRMLGQDSEALARWSVRWSSRRRRSARTTCPWPRR
jgi:tetratricopeptide (TPR) repeat protein